MQSAAAQAPSPPPAVSWTEYLRLTTIGFAAVHLAAVVGVVLVGWSWRGVALAVGMYFARMVVVTAAYHRYFAHRAFKTSRWFQFLMAVAAQTSAQRGVLWWASQHRWHHKHSDQPLDIHSARRDGFWHAHVGWILRPAWNETDRSLISDLTKYPELRFLDRTVVSQLPTVALALACLLLGGAYGLVWGFLVSTVLLWHGSFSINSLAHLVGRRRYETTDDSRNSLALAILTTGEGWHNNHHHYQSSANQGFRWWEIDVTYYVLNLLALTGLVWDLRRPPASTVAGAST
ncbi:MAG TPA: acyl-CoA desaturase [Polyangia bacterium]|nr:acyl-CoA desaturase [Polyangia bacterium]